MAQLDAKLGDLGEYTVAEILGTPITDSEGNAISLKNLLAAEVTRAKAAEDALGTRVTANEGDIDKLQETVAALLGDNSEGSIADTVEKAITIKTVQVDGVALTPDAAKAVNITGIKANADAIASLQTAVNTLNGASTVAGSVDKKVADAIAAVVADAPEDFDTLKEIADYIASDKTNAATINNDISGLKTKVASLEAGTVTNVAAGSTADKIDVTVNGVASTITVNNVANAVAATNDGAGQAISSTYLKNVAASAMTLTLTKGDNTTSTVALDAYTKAEVDEKVSAVSDQLVFATDDDITAMFA